MSKTKSITDLVTELQAENEQSRFLNRLFGQAVKHEFGYTIDELHDLIYKCKAYERKRTEQVAKQQAQQPND